MNPITALYVSITMALHGAADRLQEDDGQTSVEWIGIAAVIVAFIGVMVGFADEIGGAAKDMLIRMLESF